ncbi:hypothetical protein C8R45DRAFT_937977 [Mycena sanguinolenta]|nr:hypothetical protein C8R45DRAFT_937977 [Mycena sanguinolenta]
MTRWNIALGTSDDSETEPTCADSSFQANLVNEAHPKDHDHSLIQAISVSQGYGTSLDPNVATWTEALLAGVDPEDEELATRYRTPAITLGDKCLHHFITFVVGGTTAAIRQYSTRDEILYFASVGNGASLRWGCVAMPGPASMEEIAKEFHSQAMGSVLSRTVYNHKRFILDKSHAGESHWQSRFTTVPKSYGGVEFDWITTPDENLWLAPTQKMFVEYLMAVLAAISKFPAVMEKRLYLVHQRTFLDNRLKVERDWEFSVFTQQERMALYRQGIQENAHLFETISDSVDMCNGYPSQEQMANSLQFQEEIGPYRVALKAAIRPTLEWRRMEPEYMLHAHQTRLKFERFLSGELLALSGNGIFLG